MKEKKTDGASMLAGVLRGYMIEKGLTEISVPHDQIDSSFQDRVLTIEVSEDKDVITARLMSRNAFQAYLAARKSRKAQPQSGWNCTPTDELN